jgi:hypothetical protein
MEVIMIDADIAALDLEPIAYKVCLDEGWSIEQVDQTEIEYRAFLQSIRCQVSGLVPSRNVDIFWHHHILDTQKYIEDCELLFGRYIHHFPYAGLLGSDDAKTHTGNFTRSQSYIADIVASHRNGEIR